MEIPVITDGIAWKHLVKNFFEGEGLFNSLRISIEISEYL